MPSCQSAHHHQHSLDLHWCQISVWFIAYCAACSLLRASVRGNTESEEPQQQLHTQRPWRSYSELESQGGIIPAIYSTVQTEGRLGAENMILECFKLLQYYFTETFSISRAIGHWINFSILNSVVSL